MIPTIIIHKGRQDYARSVVIQAGRHGTVLVLGDGQDFATDRICDYSESAKEFESLFVNLSTNIGELICFTRWLMLRDFMKSKGIDICLHIDSDVLLYVNPESLWGFYDQFDFTLIHKCCGSTSYFTLRGLEKFCSFLIQTYSNKSSYEYEKIASHYHIRRKHGLNGGVCDMTLLEYYGRMHAGEVGEMMYIVAGSTWDHNINTSDQGFMMDPGRKIKKVTFVDAVPVIYNELLNKPIKFNALHFQGPAKRYIPEFLS